MKGNQAMLKSASTNNTVSPSVSPTAHSHVTITNVEVCQATRTNIHFLEVTLSSAEVLTLPLGACTKNVAGAMKAILDEHPVLSDEISPTLAAKCEATSSRLQAHCEVATPLRSIRGLAVNLQNRPVTPNRINRYGLNMEQDAWLMSGEPIIYDLEGHLIDGQSRLWAVILSGKPQIFVTIRGVDHEAQKVIDGNLARNVGDWLSYTGAYKDCPPGRKIGAYIRSIISLATGVNNLSDTHTVEYVAAEYADDLAWVAHYMDSKVDKLGCLRHSDLITGLLIFHHFYEAEADEFVRELISGEGRDPDPCLILRNYFTCRRGEGHHVDTVLARRLRPLQAARAFVNGNKFPRKHSTNRDEHGFPTIPGTDQSDRFQIEDSFVNDLLGFFTGESRRELISLTGWEKYIKKGGSRSTSVRVADAPQIWIEPPPSPAKRKKTPKASKKAQTSKPRSR